MVMDTGRFAILDDPEELMEYARPLAGDPTRQEAILAVDAVHCAACTQTIAAAIDDEHARIEVNVVSRRARLEWDPSRHALSALLARMADIGYEPRPLPLVGDRDPSRFSTRVVLPTPLGPSRHTTSPASTDRSMPRSTGVSP